MQEPLFAAAEVLHKFLLNKSLVVLADSSVGSWDIDAACPDGYHIPAPEAHVSSRQHSSTHPGVSCDVDGSEVCDAWALPILAALQH